MYVFELFTKLFKKPITTTKEFTSDDIVENSGECNHLFMPLDSSNEFFACKYCGIVVSKEELGNIKN